MSKVNQFHLVGACVFSKSWFLFTGTNAKLFSSGNNLIVTFFDEKDASTAVYVNTGIFVVGFKTTEKDAALAQLLGTDYRHFTLVLEDGYLTLFYSLKRKLEERSNFRNDNEVNVIRLNSRPLNDDVHHIARVHFATDFFYLEVPDMKMFSTANMTEHTILLPNNIESAEAFPDAFGAPYKFKVGETEKVKFREDLPKTFSGCMSGAKIVLYPQATSTNRFPKSIEIDMFKNILTGDQTQDPNNITYPLFTGSLPQDGECGKPLPVPGRFCILIFFYSIF